MPTGVYKRTISRKKYPSTTSKECLNCKSVFYKNNISNKKWETKSKYCSPECFRIKGSPFIVGHKPWNTGIPHLLGEKNPLWKGDNVGYVALHGFVRRNLLKKQGVCSFCKNETKTVAANKSHQYLRVKEDWIELCYKCHVEYDKNSKGQHRFATETLRKYRNYHARDEAKIREMK